MNNTQIRNTWRPFSLQGMMSVDPRFKRRRAGPVSGQADGTDANFLLLDEPQPSGHHLQGNLESALCRYTELYVDRYFINRTATRILEQPDSP